MYNLCLDVKIKIYFYKYLILNINHENFKISSYFLLNITFKIKNLIPCALETRACF